ncbi:MAG: hypothetical protein NT040_00400 [Bacteroidetes bacterium]|nr:hypothetical protein [Bacteroidota bacterium]
MKKTLALITIRRSNLITFLVDCQEDMGVNKNRQRAVKNFDISNMGMSKEKDKKMQYEWRKFRFLVGFVDNLNPVITRKVDEEWHLLLEDA